MSPLLLRIALGVPTRYAALLIAGDMFIATVQVHLPSGFAVSDGGSEFSFTLVFGALALVFLGRGRYSLEVATLDRELSLPSVDIDGGADADLEE